MSGCTKTLNIVSFEKVFLKKAYFLGENKLDRVLLSLLHLLDAGPRMEDYDGKLFILNEKHLTKKIRSHTNKSIRYRYKVESNKSDFSYLSFLARYGIPFDNINGIFPLGFDNPRIVFHSLKLSYALLLTLKMFRKDHICSNQRSRKGRISLSRGNLLSSIFVGIFSQLKEKNLSEQKMIKCIKNSLCLMVSQAMSQEELPEGETIELFPKEIKSYLMKELSCEEFARFSFSCLQSKVLCQEVPEDFILDTLIKHREQLSSPHRGLSQETLEFLREKGRVFGEKVKKYYRPEKGFFPTNKATFAFPRDRGGVKGDLVFHDRLQDIPSKEDPNDRMEPYVIGLFGQPGQGKSTLINQLVSEFSILFPGVSRQHLVYQRTCHTEHWDGYRGQPIVIFDDLGQSSDAHDIQEFQTLVSCNPYVLPMADLSEKGQKFCSPLIITTSNLHFGVSLSQMYQDSQVIIDDNSFWRRFTKPIYVENHQVYELKDDPVWIRTERLLFGKEGQLRKETAKKLGGLPKRDLSSALFRSKTEFTQWGDSNKWKPMETDFSILRREFLFKRKYHDNFRQNWIQTVVDCTQSTEILNPLLQELEQFGFTESFEYAEGTGETKCLNFPAFPPSGPLPVRVEPIVEPLKVRTITAGSGDTFCLKPFQRALWLALDDFPQFCLTHGTNRLENAIERIFNISAPEDVWISGDYSAATDSFSIEGSKALLEGILENIDHEPTKRWAMKEISPHLLFYPKKSGLKPVLQRSGQLMGSLLSFPLLCLLNDCTAQMSGISPDKYLINGDDILMRAKPETYPIWKERVHEFGLDLSLGKNYIHKHFGTVNSQFIIDGDVVGSGKQMVLDRRSRVLGECLRDLELNMPETQTEEIIDLFKSVNRAKLSKTVRDINVPVSHGGLSFSWGNQSKDKKSKKTALLCYLHDMFKKIAPQKGHVSIPYLSRREKVISDLRNEEMIFNDPVTCKEYHEDFLSPIDLQLVEKRIRSNQHLRDLFLNQPLESLPSLSFLRSYQIPCSDIKIRKELQNQIDSLFLSRFLQGGQDYGYNVFREDFLRNLMNLPSKENSSSTVTHLVGLMDLDIRPDWLNYLNLNFQPQSFDRSLFEKELSKELKPKEFNFSEVVFAGDEIDFSKKVIEDFWKFQNEITELFEIESHPFSQKCEEENLDVLVDPIQPVQP